MTSPQRDRTLNTAFDAFLTVQEDAKGSRGLAGQDQELDRILNSKGRQVAVIAKKNAQISKMSNFIGYRKYPEYAYSWLRPTHSDSSV